MAITITANGHSLSTRRIDSSICHWGIRSSKPYLRGSPIGFSGSGIWLIWRPGIRDFGRKRGGRFGIVILNGTRELAILLSGIREITIFFWKSGLKMYKENQAVIFMNVGNQRNKGLTLSPTYHAIKGRDYWATKCQKYASLPKGLFTSR